MEELLKRAFGVSFAVRQINAPAGLPFYMTNNRSFYEVTADDIRFLLAAVPETDKFGAVALGKQLTQYVNVSGLNTAYLFQSLTKVQRDALITRKIPFICLHEQLYLPFLGVVLSDRFMKTWGGSAEVMAPATQSLFLYLLYRQKNNAIIKKQAAQELGLTQTSITRASKQLLAMGLIREEAHGKELWIEALAVGKDYYQMAAPYLIDPVLRIITVGKTEALERFPLAGEAALSEHTMLGSPAIPVLAAFRNDPRIKGLRKVDEQWESEEPKARVELWKYDPGLFCVNNCVDPVSLSASLKKVHDERVEGELQAYMEALEW